MKRSIISAIAILLFFNQHLQAQDPYEDVVYLKNGSAFRGMIFEQVPGKSITIQSADQGVFTFTYEEIEKIRKELKQSTASFSSDAGYSSSGSMNIIQAGILTGRGNPLTTFSMTHGVLVDDHFSFALGVGWDMYGNGTMIPLFVDARSTIITGRTSPFLFADAGYSLGKLKSQQSWNAGGFVLNAGAGFIVHTSTSASFVMQVSYRFQRAKVIESGVGYDYGIFGYQPYQYSNELIVNREFVVITVGIGF